MSNNKNIAVIIGSLRQGSHGRQIANALRAAAPAGLTLNIVEIGDLPLYNQDLETDTPPAAWTSFRNAVNANDAVLFITPEYNRSVPGLLKNAIDVGSRPWGKAVWNDKPAAIISLSIGALGGFGANHHLRQMLAFFTMPVMAQPEAYIGNAGNLFDDAGQFKDAGTADFLKGFVSAFARWIEQVRR